MSLSRPLRTLFRARPTSLIATRQLHKQSALRFPDVKNKEKAGASASEYTQSGSDDQVVHNSDAAFNPNKTSPEEEKATAGQGDTGNGNPLDMSPADHDVAEAGRGKGEGKGEKGQQKRSVEKSPVKKGKLV